MRYNPNLVTNMIAPLCMTAAMTSVSSAQQTWTEQTTAAAMGYCLARHPYIARDPNNPYTAEGFEIPVSPGVVGAVRRNYVFNRVNPVLGQPDPGQNQNCQQACQQFGLNYGAPVGRSLRYRDSNGNVMADGVGDMASLGFRDFDYYNNQSVVAGMWGRPLNYHESDVAQADLCCCQLDTSTPPPPPAKACIDFEAPLIVGTRYGTPAGQNPGETVIQSNGIKISVEKFLQSNGNTAFNEAHIDNRTVPGASVQSLRLNNISIRADFTGLPFTPSVVTAKYLDLGGNENLAANDDTPFNGSIASAPATSGGATVFLPPAGLTPGGSFGEIKVSGQLKSLLIGGQEFWIDEICAER